ncbi:OmpA family protein [Pseudomonas benzenivorans]|uniref:OmpA family protein n=1 Tax=Pseudomonas benzenivorans TaxID=556533 RepID=A0ABY5H4K4_9PSED|nr:OmpA family protein [Pseudomonas benzenivorans]UTW07150.1 OmpA family protein [Pseudomonas benzenivorans]
MSTRHARVVLPLLLVSSVLSGCVTTSSTGDAPLNQGNWPLCSAIGGLAGGGLGAIESSTAAAGGALAGAVIGGLICYAQDGDEDGDGVFDRRDRCPHTPSGMSVGHNGCPLKVYPDSPAVVEAEPLEVVRVELDVKFDFDKSVVKPDGQADIRSLADFMKQYPQTNTVVEGHTDSIGTDAYNQGLSERRANAVRDVLVRQHGIDMGRVSAVGYGETRPVADNDSEAGRAINRRVEAEVEVQP